MPLFKETGRGIHHRPRQKIYYMKEEEKTKHEKSIKEI